MHLLLSCAIEAERPGDTDTARECTTATFYADADGDGLGSADYTIDACEAPTGYVADAGDCDDTDAAVRDGADFYADADADTYGDARTATRACTAPDAFVADATDCDDTDDTIHPGAEETCDGVDQDCDASVDDDPVDGSPHYADADADSYGDPLTEAFACDLPDGRVANDADCNDTLDTIHPDAPEQCDDVDEDCDGVVDDNVAAPPTWYADLDGDGYAGASLSFAACDAPANYYATSDDCDDTDATVSPVGTEHCNDCDDDCDGEIDEAVTDAPPWYADTDGDGFGDPAVYLSACDEPADHVADATDCDDTDAAVSPADDEVCGGTDEDCDGETDEDSAIDASTFYEDADGDGYGDTAGVACTLPAGWYTTADDCDSANASIHPGAAEDCGNAIDDDCNGEIDDACLPAGTVYDTDATVRIDGAEDSDLLGYDPDGFAAGDLDGDGIADLVLGTEYARAGGSGTDYAYAGAVWVIRGPLTSGVVDDVARMKAYGTSESEYVGDSVAILGDIDGDGTEDVGSEWWYHTDVLVFAGTAKGDVSATTAAASGSRLSDDAWGTLLGLEGVDDWNGDGADDFAVGSSAGVQVYLGPIGTGVVNLTGEATLDIAHGTELGERMAQGDFDDDGYSDLAVSSRDFSRVYLCHGPTTAASAAASACPDMVSIVGGVLELANVGDVDGDGTEDLGIGDYDSAEVWVLPGDISGAVAPSSESILNLDGDKSEGWMISGRDMDGDGLSELAISDQWASTFNGLVYFYASPGGGEITPADATATFTGTSWGWYLGESTAIVPDVTGEGCDDIVLAAAYAANNGTNSGSVYLFPCE